MGDLGGTSNASRLPSFSFPCSLGQKLCQTRMHSSRMRTAHLLPISPSIHCSEGGVPGSRRCISFQGEGVYLVRGWGVGVVPGLGFIPVPIVYNFGIKEGCIWSTIGVPGLKREPKYGGVSCPGIPPVDRMTDTITFANFVCGR